MRPARCHRAFPIATCEYFLASPATGSRRPVKLYAILRLPRLSRSMAALFNASGYLRINRDYLCIGPQRYAGSYSM